MQNGDLTALVRELPDIEDAEQWERAVEDILMRVAKAVERGVMRQEDYTRKTQALAKERRRLVGEHR